jgi:hypothetical protein
MNDEELSDESLLWRRPPPSPYVLPAAVLTVPASVWEQTIAAFARTALHRLEACCFWYGLRAEDGSAVVHAVVVPKQRNTWGNYFVPAPAMAEVAAATRPERWVNLSQLHTHPGAGVEHSRYDDAHANSRRALSIVVPYYGRWRGTWPKGIGVHELQDGYWHLLSDADAGRRVVVGGPDLPARLVDFR